ncbi:MAG: universal stress protein, partial [Acidobacteria bacterium]|nr:universal stress protein [Acidobacteriota bacterium]
MKILLAIDGSACSEAAVGEVVQRPWPAGSSVRVLSVVESPVPSGPETAGPPETYFDKVRRAAVDQSHLVVETAA